MDGGQSLVISREGHSPKSEGVIPWASDFSFEKLYQFKVPLSSYLLPLTSYLLPLCAIPPQPPVPRPELILDLISWWI